MDGYAKLKIVDGEYSVIDCHCHFTRNYDYAEPVSNARCERVDLLIDNVGAGNLSFYKWFVNKETKSGSVIFYQDKGQESKIKEITFETASCFSLTEEFKNSGESTVRTIKLSFMADKITINNVDFQKI